MAPRILQAEIQQAQSEHAQPPTEFDGIIRAAVIRTLEEMDNRQIPARPIVLRPPGAARMLGIDEDTLRSDRALPNPKVRFRKFGTRVLYKISDLEACIDALPCKGGA
jgi:hypothetical protein